MANKKQLLDDLSGVLNKEEEKVQTRQPFNGKPGRPARGEIRQNTQNELCYTSLVLEKEPYEKIREIARANGLSYKDLVSAAIRKFVELYEAKHGPIQTSRESKISAESLI